MMVPESLVLLVGVILEKLLSKSMREFVKKFLCKREKLSIRRRCEKLKE